MSGRDDLDGLRSELDQARAELKMFAYRASHDLGEPLRTVAGFAQLLQRRYGGQLDEHADEMLGYVVGGAERMRDMLDALLEYSRVGFADPRIEPADARVAAMAALVRLEELVERSGGRIELGALPVVHADPDQLARVLCALIANGLIFCDDGPPEIEVRAEGDGDGHCRLLVLDRGIGIDPAEAERAWEPFVRLHGHRYPGTGLGLALVRRVAERNGWPHALRPREGGGTEVELLLPVA
jgi:light-regulated signal transduction histidine kinase (bacteriophytochrome)